MLLREPKVEWVIYLDADLYFYKSPTPILEEMNKGDVGFFGSQVAKTIGEATGALFDFFRDKSPDNDNETVEPEAKVAAPAMPQFTASPGFGSGPG